MKMLLTLFIVITSIGYSQDKYLSEDNLGLSLEKYCNSCGLTVEKSYTQSVLGVNVGYYVEFHNKSGKTIDAVEWNANFYNNFEDYIGTRKGEWSSGNFVSPIENEETFKDLEGVWVEGATKIKIKVTRVHYTDGSSCEK